MMGKHNSVQTLLKNDVPHLVIVQCLCHSLALCSSYAFSKLPRVVHNLLQDIPSYLQHSYKRQEAFKKFQQFTEACEHKILHNCQTRWLSLSLVVERFIEQYHALKLYFTSEYLDENVAAS